ncbi:MAG: helix-turn-helix transcriptional regulator [Oscillospiraceae bacterium]|jgi:transcriptional regulator with XRE-family HTH domain|nr:helix-turn-helix transcriptional regulator [Oscillospiraceae bacterium]
MNAAAALRQLMSDQNVTQVELAKRTGLTKSAISQLCSGATKPSKKNLPKLADALHCTVDDLTGETDEAPTNGTRNLTTEETARLLGKSPQFIRVSLQQRTAPFGFAAEMPGGEFSYHISAKLLAAYIGE